jgi:hypothetical protein
MFKYFSYWGLHFATISLICSYFSAEEPSNYYLKRIGLVTMEIALITNIISTFIYWFVIKDEVTSKLNWRDDIERRLLIHLAFLHLVPLIVTLINFFMTNIAFF